MECPVCLEPYGLQHRRPKVLPCGHSVCLNCLQNPGFGRQCPQDRKKFQERPDQLPDNILAINLMSQGVAPQRPWCRDCGKDSTDDCLEASHRITSQRQRRAERMAPLAEEARRGVAVKARLERHFDALQADLLQDLATRRAALQQLEDGLARLESAALSGADFEGAVQAVERMSGSIPRLEESASLAGLRGRCTVAVQAEDGAEWRASVALEDGKRHALRHALLELQADGELVKVDSSAKSSSEGGRNNKPSSEQLTNEGGDHLICRTLDLSQMKQSEGTDFLQQGFLKQVRSLSGLDCSKGIWSYDLLLSVAPHLESLEMFNPLDIHMQALEAMTALRKLTVSNKQHVPDSSDLPPNLVELHIGGATRRHMKMIKGMAKLRKLNFQYMDGTQTVAALPSQLQHLTMENPQKQHLLNVQMMFRLTRLSVVDYTGDAVDFQAPPSSGHSGLSWLRFCARKGYLQTALSLIRAHATTLQELEFLCASRAPTSYCLLGLTEGLKQCGLRSLRRLLLRRTHPTGPGANHDAESCRAQKRDVADALRRIHPTTGEVTDVLIECEICDKK